MRRKVKSARAVCAATALVALGALFAAPAALAHSGEYAEFDNCPSTNPSVITCLHATSSGGEFVLGNKKVPLVNPVTLQGGVTAVDPATGFAKLVAPTSGEALTKAAQPVPGGLSGLVNCKEISLGWLRASCEVIFENGLTGVNSTVELAKPASEVKVNLLNILFQREVGIQLPVKVHLENPLLGSSCYIGSSSSPINLSLTTGKTAPPLPNESISGSKGTVEIKGEGEGILRLNGNKLVDNAWSAPGATGCGGFLVEYILNPIINASVGVPSAAGHNTAILTGVADESPASTVNAH
ncbi:MAG: hypothetical protein JST08_21910 [Actinobacteria bacterium]|nr:hypothetical protein [Actinomycetota bacterium]